MSKFIKNKILGLFVKTNGVISKPLFGGIGHVFMLHRINSAEERLKYPINKNLIITPDFLEKKIIQLKNNNYDFISLDQLHIILHSGKKPKRRFVSFTIDDGYKDNITFGLPIFEKYNIPFAIYVTNSFPNKTASLWWYWLEEKIYNFDLIKYDGREFNTKTPEEKFSTYNNLRNTTKNLSLEKRNQLESSLFNKNKEAIRHELESIVLSWADLKQIQKHPLITLGTHTINHLSLANISFADAMSEINDGKKELEDNLGFKAEHFAYPYGGKEDINEQIIKFASQLNFKTAVINHPGNIFLNSIKQSFCLPRYPLGNNTSNQQFEYFLNGIHHFSVNKFRPNGANSYC